jgi:hypothetical protein
LMASTECPCRGMHAKGALSKSTISLKRDLLHAKGALSKSTISLKRDLLTDAYLRLDIERGLRERSSRPPSPDRLFMEGVNSPLNPQSPFIRCWRTGQSHTHTHSLTLTHTHTIFLSHRPSLSLSLSCDSSPGAGGRVSKSARFTPSYMW